MDRLTEQEEKAMIAVWRVGPGFLKDFLEKVEEPRPVYTTFASTLTSLEKKGFLVTERFGAAKRYSAKIPENEYKQKFMSTLVNGMFKNSFKDVVAFFAREKKVSAEELKQIIELIENSKK